LSVPLGQETRAVTERPGDLIDRVRLGARLSGPVDREGGDRTGDEDEDDGHLERAARALGDELPVVETAPDRVGDGRDEAVGEAVRDARLAPGEERVHLIPGVEGLLHASALPPTLEQRTEESAELLLRPGHARLSGRLGDREDPSHFLERELLDSAQDDDGALLLGQTLESRAKQLAFFSLSRDSDGPLGGFGETVATETARRGALAPLETAERDVRRDPVDPGRELGVAAERAEVSEDVEEDFLRGVLGVVGADECRDDAVNPVGVKADDLVEGAPVASACTPDEVCLGLGPGNIAFTVTSTLIRTLAVFRGGLRRQREPPEIRYGQAPAASAKISS